LAESPAISGCWPNLTFGFEYSVPMWAVAPYFTFESSSSALNEVSFGQNYQPAGGLARTFAEWLWYFARIDRSDYSFIFSPFNLISILF
jgi:hypothetical protein